METSLTDTRIRAMTGAGLWRDESLEVYLDRWARERPTKTALVDGATRYTWAALARGAYRPSSIEPPFQFNRSSRLVK